MPRTSPPRSGLPRSGPPRSGPPPLHRYAIALGSNRRHGRHGRPEQVIAAALAALQATGVEAIAVSPVIRTAAIGPAGRGFANAAALIASPLPPLALLALLKGIERHFGRRRGRRWGARVIDLDILLWSGGVWPPGPRLGRPGRLIVPHPGLPMRAFVLDPLVHIAPGWRQPPSNRTVLQIWTRLHRRRPCDRAGFHG